MSADDAPGVDADDARGPNDMALAALEAAIAKIDSVEPSDTIAYARAQDEAVAEFATELAEAADAGLPESRWSQYCGSLASESRLLNKTDIKNAVEAEISAKVDRATGTYPGLFAYLEDHVESIDAVRSTDAKQSTLYRWKLYDGEFGPYQIETGSDAETSHFRWWELRSAIFDVSGIWTAEPPEEIADDWNDLIGPFIQERSEEVKHKGPRTCAVESLQNYVHRTEAYATIEDMVDFHGVRIDDDPDEGDPSEIWVTNTEVSKICDDHAISERALQVELEARGYTVGRVGGVSETTFVHGDKFTYWVLDGEFAEPLDYVTDPETATERYENMLRGDRPAGDPGRDGAGAPDPDVDPAELDDRDVDADADADADAAGDRIGEGEGEGDEPAPGVIGSTDDDIIPDTSVDTDTGADVDVDVDLDAGDGWIVFNEATGEVVERGFGTEAEALGWTLQHGSDDACVAMRASDVDAGADTDRDRGDGE